VLGNAQLDRGSMRVSMEAEVSSNNARGVFPAPTMKDLLIVVERATTTSSDRIQY
jgi:hypothetical protein